MNTAKQQLAVLMAFKYGTANHISLDRIVEELQHRDGAKQSAVWSRAKECLSLDPTFERFIGAIAEALDDQVVKILVIAGDDDWTHTALSTAIDYVRISYPMVDVKQKEQLAILVALRAAFEGGYTLSTVVSRIKAHCGGASSDLWAQVAERIKSDAAFESVVAAIEGIFDPEVVDILSVLSRAGHADTALAAAIEYIQITSSRMNN